MSERDAFGREQGEDTLADMGWNSSVRPQAAPAPAPQATFTAGDLPPDGPPPAWTPGPRQTYVRRRRRSAFGVIVPLFVIAIFAVGIGGVVTAFNAGSDALDGITSSIESSTNGTATTTPSDGTTLIDAKALASALDKLPAGDIQMLRVAPERINANISVNGKLHVVQVTAGGDVSDVTTPADGQGDSVKVNPAAPARIVRTAAKRAGRRPSDLNYLVLMHLAGKDEWQLFFADGTHYAGSAGGTKVRKVG
jgi:hypothetical protein